VAWYFGWHCRNVAAIVPMEPGEEVVEVEEMVAFSDEVHT
jgi:hypothetical protein